MSTSTSIDGYYLFASSTAGLVARTITYPMDTIKTRLQTMTLYGTHFELFKKVTSSQKPSSLYRGLNVTLLFSVPALSMYLSCYEASKQVLETNYRIDRDSIASHALSGCAAEIASGVLFTPMEVMKNRLQTGSTHVFTTIFQKEGLRGFYKGYWMGLVVFLPHSVAYFVTYEKMKQWTNAPTALNYMLCSTVAGITSIMLSTPLDIIKTRWQISAADHGKQFRQGPIAIAKHMLKEKGSLTRGLWARIAWGIPTTAISMTIFELLKTNRITILEKSSNM